MHNDSRLNLTANHSGSNDDSKSSVQLRSQQTRRKPRVLFTQSQVALMNLLHYPDNYLFFSNPMLAMRPIRLKPSEIWRK